MQTRFAPYDTHHRRNYTPSAEYNEQLVFNKQKRRAHPLDILSEDINIPRKQLDEIISHKYEGPIQYIRSLCYCTCVRVRDRNRQKAQPEFVQHVIDLYNEQQGKCAISGVQMTWNEVPNNTANISIDRIDSSKGYEIGNVRLITIWINNALSNHGEDVMWYYINSMIQRREQKLAQSKNNDDNISLSLIDQSRSSAIAQK